MQKKILIGSIVGIGLLLISLTALLYTFQPKVKLLTNVTDLYILFTPLMEKVVNESLEQIICNPSKYYYLSSYYEGSAMCFLCDWCDACFGYGVVLRDGDFKLNFNGIKTLENIKEFSEKNVDFYLNGLGTKLDCHPINKTTLSCDYSVFITFKENNVVPTILLLDNSNFENISKAICSNFNKPEIECSENKCKCIDLIIYRLDGGEVIYAFQ